MYDACMPSLAVSDRSLQRLDEALVVVRRLWEQPAVRQRFAELLGRPVELSVFRTLRAIATAGPEACVARVAELLHVDQSTASRAVESAVAAGYVARTPSEADRRRTHLSLTDAGSELLAAGRAARAALIAEIVGGWPPEDIATLAHLLDRFITDATTVLEPSL